MIKTTLTLATASILTVSSAQAAFLDITFDGTTKDLLTVELESGSTVNAGDLVNVTLTDIDDASLIIMTPDGTTTAPADRSALIEDLSLATGLINPDSFEVQFNTPIVNRAGVDFLIFDYGGVDSDNFTITTPNASSKVYGGSSDQEDESNLDIELFDASAAIANVADLESVGFTVRGGSSTSQIAGVVGIDLTDFGYGAGASIGSFVYTGDGTDPSLILGVEAVPEPASLALLAAGMLCLCSRRRA